jgi:hypothetical protein
MYNEHCDARNTKHHINISTVVHPRFEALSSAIHYGHLIPTSDG